MSKEKLCECCWKPIESSIIVNGKRKIVRKDRRRYCIKCLPFGKILHRSIRLVIDNNNNIIEVLKTRKLKSCKCCGNDILSFHIIQNKIKRVSETRIYCFDCLPYEQKHGGTKITLDENNEPHINTNIEKLFKVCNGCNFNLPNTLEYFEKRPNRKCLTPICKKCHNKYNNKNHNNKKTIAVEIKGGKCQICGYNKCNQSLDFHHIDPSKKEIIISKITSMKILLTEIEKCLLVCRNCHGEIHAGLHENILKMNYSIVKASIKKRLKSKENKQKCIDYLGGECKICKYKTNIRSIDFHHVNPDDKLFNINEKLKRNMSFEKLKSELDKCILLCANCHQEEHERLNKL